MPDRAGIQGLTSAEAARRLAEFGPNTVADTSPNVLRTLLGKFWAPVPWMLEAAILLQMSLREYAEAAVIAALLVLNAALAFFQEGRAQAALSALKSRLAPTATVRRDGAWTKLSAASLVPGDIVQLSLGAIVPADMRLLTGAVLLDEAVLTGESVPVEAGPGHLAYAGALVRRGEAVAETTATGARTYFGKAAELVRLAHSEGGEQHAVMGVVRNLAVFNGAIVVLLVVYAHLAGLPTRTVVPLVLTSVLASIPVALPATFTLATALSAMRLAKRGVLPTRLSAVHEIATMDVLCADKTGTLTRSELRVAAVRPLLGYTEDRVLALAAAASSPEGRDPVDGAIRDAASRIAGAEELRVVRFVPFDPAAKRSEAVAQTGAGQAIRIVKGAYSAVAAVAAAPPGAAVLLDELAAQGSRVLAVAVGAREDMRVVGLVALSDPPRPDSAPLIAELGSLGVRTVMVTGDAPATATAIARAVGISGPVCPAGQAPERTPTGDCAVYAGVFPADKFRLVRAFQKAGHTVGMCGDGANDAPALRQAQVGIAVSTATDIAKSAAGIVLTEPGLGGIVSAVREGRSTFQRILTYTLNALVKKTETVLFLAIGLVMTGHAILTPMLMVLVLVTADFLTMSLTTDTARSSPRPERWRIGRVTTAAIILGLCKLAFSLAVVAVGFYVFELGPSAMRTLAFVVLVLGGQAVVYAIRERGHLWASRPGPWLILSSLADIGIAIALAWGGILMAPLPGAALAGVLAAAVAFSLLLDTVKVPIFRRLGLAETSL